MSLSSDISLNRYVSVDCGNEISYGGNQQWFSADENRRSLKRDNVLHHGGCGLVAACDFMLHYCRKNNLFTKNLPGSFTKSGGASVSKEDYLQFLRKTSFPYYPVFPFLGSFSFQIPLTLNHFLKKAGSQKRIRLVLKKNTRTERLKLIRASLKEGYPVILMIGRTPFSFLFKDGVPFYRFRNGVPYKAGSSVRAHFVNITGVHVPDDAAQPLYLTVSSWGKKYFIRYDELNRYISRTTPLFSHLYVLR